MRYGVPYKGSKSRIASKIIDLLPEADTFVDLFAGGCAVTHAAMLSGKYKHFIINDLDGRGTQLFCDSMLGKYSTSRCPEWITREEFHARKDTDPYVALCWSFGNDMNSYLYGKNIEDWKHAYHTAVFYGDLSEWHAMEFDAPVCTETDIAKRYEFYKAIIRGTGKYPALESLERLQRLQSLERLCGLQGLQNLGSKNLERFRLDYKDVAIPDDAVIYCDIPYRSRWNKYGSGINYEEFYSWASDRKNVFVSEYEMPANFKEVSAWEVRQLAPADTNTRKAVEKLWRAV